MGFIEELEQRNKEEIKKWQEEKERETKARQEEQEKLRIQETTEMEDKKRLYRLWRESESQFNASGLGTMLGRLRSISAISEFSPEKSDWETIYGYSKDGTLPPEEVWPEKYWKEFKNKDGAFHVKVVVSTHTKSGSGYRYTVIEKSFNIIADPSGSITFKYGGFFGGYNKIDKSVWQQNPNELEKLLEKSFKSPIVTRTAGESSPPESRGWNS